MLVHNVVQGEDSWFKIRAGLPSASNFSKIITSTGDRSKSLHEYAVTLACEKFAGKHIDAWEGNYHTERGTLLEPSAISSYCFIHDCEAEQVGFVTDDECTYGCSPDRQIGISGLLEIKCLKAENHVKVILYHKKNKRTPPDYIQQTQGQLFICEREWCDLVFYHPGLPMEIIRQFRDENIISSLRDAINDVIVERDRILSQIKDNK